MTRLLVALILSLSAAWTGPASAASPEQRYLAARDAYIKTIGHDETDRGFERHNAALADLEAQLGAIIGPTTLKGFPPEGKIHLDTLYTDDEGFGLVDGLMYRIPLDDKGIDDKVSVVVTTRSLFEAWLKAHKTKWRGQAPLPQDLPTALKSDEFYREALSTDAAVVTYAQLPVAKPAWARTAYAVLATRTQDLVPSTPTEMDIVVIGSGRAYFATAKTEAVVGPVAACETIRQQIKDKAQEVWAAYERAGDRKSTRLN